MTTLASPPPGTGHEPDRGRRQGGQDQAPANLGHQPPADVPPPGTPLTGGGGLLPAMRPSQVAPRTVVTVLLTTLVVAGALYLAWELRQILRWLVVALFLASRSIPPSAG